MSTHKPRLPSVVGNTCGDSAAQLINDVERKGFDRLPDDTWFYPGHADGSTRQRRAPHLKE